MGCQTHFQVFLSGCRWCSAVQCSGVQRLLAGCTTGRVLVTSDSRPGSHVDTTTVQTGGTCLGVRRLPGFFQTLPLLSQANICSCWSSSPFSSTSSSSPRHRPLVQTGGSRWSRGKQRRQTPASLTARYLFNNVQIQFPSVSSGWSSAILRLTLFPPLYMYLHGLK